MAQEIFIILHPLINREIKVLCSTQIQHLNCRLHDHFSDLHIQMHLVQYMRPLLEMVRPAHRVLKERIGVGLLVLRDAGQQTAKVLLICQLSLCRVLDTGRP